MIAFNKSIQSFGRIAFKGTLVNPLNIWIKNGRLCSTEAKALQPLTFSSRRYRKTNPYDFGSFVLLVIPISSFGLGVWQVFRKFEKDKINDAFMERTRQPTVDLPKNLDELKDMELCSVRVKGKFDHSKEIYLGPRPLIQEDSLSKAISLLSNTKPGYLVVTPFKLSDRNLTILVNRGWVSTKNKSPETRKEGQITNEIELVGLVRNHEIRKPFGAQNYPEQGVWVYRDLYAMAEVTGASPVYIDAVSAVTGGPVAGQSLVEFKNDHVSYIITWFSLCGVSGYLWYLRFLQKLKGR